MVVLALAVAGGAGLARQIGNPSDSLAASMAGHTVLQDSSTALDWSSGWKTVRTASALGGTERATGKAGATMSLTYVGTKLQVVGPTRRAGGKLVVTVDGKSQTVSTHASSFHARQVLFTANTAAGVHDLTITFPSGSVYPFVAIDAIVISPVEPASANNFRHRHPSNPDPTPTPTPIGADPTNPPTGAPTPTAPAPTPTPLPTPIPTPTPIAKTVSGISVPASIDATGATDVSGKLLSFIASVPDGSTVVFAAGGTYRLNHGLVVTNRHNLVFEGNGATLKAMGSGSAVTDSPFALDDGDNGITIRDFNLVGNNPDTGSKIYHSGSENQMGIAMYGAKNVEIANVSISHTWGDCLYVAATGAGNIWSDTVWFHDSTCSLAGRDGVAIVSGSHVTIENNHFDTMGMHVLDIEPDTSIGGGTYVAFRTNTVGIYGLGTVYTGYFFAADGAAGSTIHDVTVSGNTVAGNPHDGYDGSIRGLSTTVEVARRANIIFTNNTSSQAIRGPVLLFADVDGLTVSGNSEPLSGGSLTSISASTSVHSQ